MPNALWLTLGEQCASPGPSCLWVCPLALVGQNQLIVYVGIPPTDFMRVCVCVHIHVEVRVLFSVATRLLSFLMCIYAVWIFYCIFAWVCVLLCRRTCVCIERPRLTREAFLDHISPRPWNLEFAAVTSLAGRLL